MSDIMLFTEDGEKVPRDLLGRQYRFRDLRAFHVTWVARVVARRGRLKRWELRRPHALALGRTTVSFVTVFQSWPDAARTGKLFWSREAMEMYVRTIASARE